MRCRRKRTFFAKEQTREAKHKGKEIASSFAFWFRRKYQLSPIDPRFLGLTPEDVETEFYAYHELENDATEDFDDPDFNLAELMDDNNDWETVINE
jgi:hypothetical protein